jgi:hypothetical protein
MSAKEPAATTNTMLTVGRVADTFTTKTVAGKDGKGSAFDGLSLLTLGLFGLYGRWSRLRRRALSSLRSPICDE